MTGIHIDTLILGAGPAGLTAGYKLATEHQSICIVDTCDKVGGLAKTLVHDDFLCDIGPHILCSREYVYDFNPEMYAFIQHLLGAELYEYESANRHYLESVQVGHGKYTYPVRILNAVQNAGFGGSVAIGFDYLHAKFSAGVGDDYESSLVSSLGRKLSELFLLQIGEKTWGMPCSKMSADVAWRVGDFSIFDVLKKQWGSFTDGFGKKGNPVNYPKHGIGVICDRLKEEIESTGHCAWRLSSTPQKISVEQNRVVSVEIGRSDTDVESVYPEKLISSIPLLDLVEALSPKPPAEIIAAAQSLRCRSHICVYLVFQTDSILPEHCIYFADPEIPFARMMEQNHYSKDMVPVGKTVLGIEYFCWFDDDVWNLSDSQICSMTRDWLQKLGIICDQSLLDFFVHREKDAYPAYELGYEANLGKVREYLDRISNLQIIGRVGSFSYIGQYKAMQMGWDAAESILLSDDVGGEV